MSLLGCDASGYEDGFSREGYPATLQQHPKEDNQVSVLSDKGEDVVYGRQGLIILLAPQAASIHRESKEASRKLGFRQISFSETGLCVKECVSSVLMLTFRTSGPTVLLLLPSGGRKPPAFLS